MKREIPEFILERVFESVDEHGVTGTVTLRLGKPYPVPEATSNIKWRCPLQITGIGSERISEAPGIDSIAALLNGLLLADGFIRAYSAEAKKRILWQDEEGTALLPLSETDEPVDSEFDAEDFQQIFDEFFRKFGSKNKP
jgi:hypothetical protein